MKYFQSGTRGMWNFASVIKQNIHFATLAVFWQLILKCSFRDFAASIHKVTFRTIDKYLGPQVTNSAKSSLYCMINADFVKIQLLKLISEKCTYRFAPLQEVVQKLARN